MQNSPFLHFASIGLFVYLFICLFPPPAGAFTMSNDSWIIEMGNFVTSGGRATDTKHKVVGALGQGALALYTGKNYIIHPGFPGSSTNTQLFSFTISENTIDFGQLTATNPVTRTSTLTLSNPGSNGYQVIAYEQTPLHNENNIQIPDTTCDNGACTETTSAPWTNHLTYGFGYRCDPISKISCSIAFREADYFRQFADISKDESPQTILIGQDASTNRKAKITYKVNIAGTQMPGTYGNTIVYIAAPTY